MKKNLIKISSLLFCLMLTLSAFAQEKKNDPALYAGSWKFTVSNAPYGYENGTAEFRVEEGVLQGEFKMSGGTIKVNSFTEKDTGYSSKIYVEGYPIDVTLTYKDNKPVGKADDGYKDYAITFTKE